MSFFIKKGVPIENLICKKCGETGPCSKNRKACKEVLKKAKNSRG